VIGVLVSGEGTNLQAMIDAGLPISAVASNKTKAHALDRAARAGIDAGAFPAVEFSNREERDVTMADFLEDRGVQLDSQIGRVGHHPLVVIDELRQELIEIRILIFPAVDDDA